MIKIVFSFVFGVLAGMGFSQSPIAVFEMDCSLADSTGTFQNISTPSFANCECGIDGEAFELGGLPMFTVDTAVSAIIADDFAVAFYFQPLAATNSMELLTLGNNCSSDSIIRVYYLDDMKQILFDMNESILEGISLRGTIATNKCWQHVIISRQGNSFFLYLNGELVDEIIFSSDIVLDISEPFKIGHGPCVGVLSNEYEGLIDRVQFFDQHVEPFKADELYIRNSEILSNDTTIFEGDIISLEATPNCTGDIAWLPATGISSTTAFVTDLEGIETTTYVARFDGDFCVSTDTIVVFVIDPNEVLCDGLLLPNVFSPNGDGLNDDFGILNGFIIEEMRSFEIFDRWGEVVFSTDQKALKWDGSFKNRELTSNLFLYKVVYNCSGEEFVKTGNVSILR